MVPDHQVSHESSQSALTSCRFLRLTAKAIRSKTGLFLFSFGREGGPPAPSSHFYVVLVTSSSREWFLWSEAKTSLFDSDGIQTCAVVGERVITAPFGDDGSSIARDANADVVIEGLRNGWI